MSSIFSQLITFIRFFSLEFLTGLAAAIVLGFLSQRIWLIVFVVLLAVFLIYGVFSRKYKILKAGPTGYFYTFDSNKDCKIFIRNGEVADSFSYLGVSGDSIIELFRKWVAHGDLISAYNFLLMNPDSPNLKWQIAFEKGVSLGTDFDSLTVELKNTINREVTAARQRIRSCIELLKTLPPYKSGNLHIKLYDPFIPYWMYIMDKKTIYLGIMENGKRGHDSPVLVIARRQHYASLFDTFKNSWDKLWMDAIEIKE